MVLIAITPGRRNIHLLLWSQFLRRSSLFWLSLCFWSNMVRPSLVANDHSNTYARSDFCCLNLTKMYILWADSQPLLHGFFHFNKNFHIDSLKRLSNTRLKWVKFCYVPLKPCANLLVFFKFRWRALLSSCWARKLFRKPL